MLKIKSAFKKKQGHKHTESKRNFRQIVSGWIQHNLFVEPEKAEQSFSKICFLDNIDRPREVKILITRCRGLLYRFFLKYIYSSMENAAIQIDF